MLSNIQTSPKPASDSEDAISLLLGCHQRIRHFTEVALRLAQSPEAPASDRADAARSVLRYFQVALPLHEADENESIYPRLRRKLPAGALAQANEDMVRQHTEIDDTISELVPQWQAVAQLSEQPRELLSKTAHLQELWGAHLALEEQHVIPALRKHLSLNDLNAIRAEMSARRQS